VQQQTTEITIHWQEHIEGDFSFTARKVSPTGLVLNAYGQMVCDGICSEESEAMKDEFGRVHPDSLVAYYKLVDTARLHYAIHSSTNAPEYFHCPLINFQQINKDTIVGETEVNAATHSSLIILLTEKSCIPSIHLNSITGTTIVYPYKSGDITIDPILYKQGIIKARFAFEFTDINNPDSTLFWKGLIYDTISPTNSTISAFE